MIGRVEGGKVRKSIIERVVDEAGAGQGRITLKGWMIGRVTF